MSSSPPHTGTVYFQQTVPFLIMSGFCVYSVASALFMFPALYSYYVKALEIYTFEHADSAGRAYDLVLQPFVRFITMAIIPVILCAFVLYVLVSMSNHLLVSFLCEGVLINPVIISLSLPVASFLLILPSSLPFLFPFSFSLSPLPSSFQSLPHLSPSSFLSPSVSLSLLPTSFQSLPHLSPPPPPPPPQAC